MSTWFKFTQVKDYLKVNADIKHPLHNKLGRELQSRLKRAQEQNKTLVVRFWTPGVGILWYCPLRNLWFPRHSQNKCSVNHWWLLPNWSDQEGWRRLMRLRTKKVTTLMYSHNLVESVVSGQDGEANAVVEEIIEKSKTKMMSLSLQIRRISPKNGHNQVMMGHICQDQWSNRHEKVWRHFKYHIHHCDGSQSHYRDPQMDDWRANDKKLS